uniref:Uncharacterized protein n=1 Tax=Arundo donax TaxID=35708 RepID=A0A0A8ZJE6_ARUDO
MMGYFRAPPRLQGRKQAAGRPMKGALHGGDSLTAALLDAGELAAPPKGCFAVYVGAAARRFVVPTSYLCQPAFRDLMERAAEEFEFAAASPAGRRTSRPPSPRSRRAAGGGGGLAGSARRWSRPCHCSKKVAR